MLDPITMTLEEAFGVISEWAASQSEIYRVWVFGSRVKGEANSESDIDVAVEAFGGKTGEIHWFKVGDLWKDELSNLLPWKVDLQWFDPEGTTPYVQKGLADQSRRVFSRDD